MARDWAPPLNGFDLSSSVLRVFCVSFLYKVSFDRKDFNAEFLKDKKPLL